MLACSTNILGTTSLANTGGTVVFTIYFTSLGSQMIAVTSSSISSTIAVNVLSEELKIIAFTPVLFM